MCGIFGAVSFRDPFHASDWARFEQLTEIVHHRGPDAGQYVSYAARGSARQSRECFDVFLGHRRLSILDLGEQANQPFSLDGKTWIVFNGEIFNFVELRQELESKGYSFSTASDTEVLLRLYNEYGTEGFNQLNGMWAFAILDLPRHLLVLSRDRFSIKPLYLLESNARLYFASEIKQLVPLLGSIRLNQRTMASYLNQGLTDYGDETFYEGIRQVKPKKSIIVNLDSGRMEEQAYWDYQLAPLDHLSLDDATERFRELFRDSIRIRLRSDVPVGALVSGGLDSAAIAVTADALHPGLQCYAAVSSDPRYSEEVHVDNLCREKSLNCTKYQLTVDHALALLDHATFHNDEPLCGFSALAHHGIMRNIKEQTDLTVLLSGQGGDETLLGYLRFFFFWVKYLARSGRLGSALSEVAGSLWNGTCLRQFDFGKARKYLPAMGGRFHNRPFIRLQCEADQRAWQAAQLTQRQMYEIDSYSVPQLTHYEDRNSMAYSLEIRLPFLDHRLVEFALSLPTEMKLRKGWTKYILRQSIPELPASIRWRKDKQGFLTPERTWLRHDLASRIQNTFEDSLLDSMGIVDGKIFLDYYDRFCAGAAGINHAEISRVFLAEVWARKTFVLKPAAQWVS